jgi:hypothetical protein
MLYHVVFFFFVVLHGVRSYTACALLDFFFHFSPTPFPYHPPHCSLLCVNGVVISGTCWDKLFRVFRRIGKNINYS